MNGVITVQVFNTLVVPANSTTDSVDILCHMSAGSDFKVGAPTDQYIRDMTFFPPVPPQAQVQPPPTTTASSDLSDANPITARTVFEPQSGIIYDVQMDSSNDPVSPGDGAPEALTIAHHFGSSLPDDTMICDQYMGECIESLRVLVHRKQYHSGIPVSNLDALVFLVRTISDFPNHPGDIRVSLGNSTQERRNVNMTFLNYVTPAYALRSGGISNTYVISNIGNQFLDPGVIKISRAEKGAIASEVNFNISATNGGQWIYNGQPAQGRMAGNSGMHATPRLVNPVLDVNLPYYDNLNGYPAQMSALDEGNAFCRMHRLEGYERTVDGLYQRYVCAGPDYSLGMFLSAPPVYLRVFTLA